MHTRDTPSARLFTVVARSASGCTFTSDGHFIARNYPSSTGPATVVFRTRRAQCKGFSKPLPRGLWAEVTGPAPDLKSAITSLGQAAQSLVPVLVIAANSPIRDLAPELAFESTKGLEEREFFQQFLLDERLLPFERRPVPCHLASAILEALGRNPEHERIHRVLAHYHHALNNWGLGTEILALAHVYMGMEALTPVVLRRLLTHKGVTKQDLIAQWLIQANQLDAEVRRRILFKEDIQLYREVKRASDGFEHGFLTFPDIRETAVRHREPAARFLREAIFASLDLAKDIVEQLTAPPYDQPFSLDFAKYVWGKLIGKGDDLAAPDQQYPILRLRSEAIEEPSSGAGDPKVEFKETITPSLRGGVKFQVLRYEVWGSKRKPDP